MPATLVIANKAYSSWSLRPWLLMRALDIPFDEIVVPLHQPGTAAAIARYSPAGKLPVLVDGAVTIWDSLAIIEYIADTHPALPVWPEDRAARALARALSAEMHSGFVALRRGLPMNMRRAPKPVAIDDEIVSDIRRIEFAWADARARFGRDGSFLFGAFCAADAMFAPVINRLHAYAVEVSEQTATYMAAMMAMPGWQDWHAGAAAEGWRNARTDAL
jgi:glutathione S-transferase